MTLQSFWKAVIVKKPSAPSMGADEAILSKGAQNK
jgi:hypothetical protein